MTTPLIDRDLLFGNPERAHVRISPDGRWLSFLAPDEGVLNVWVAPADDLEAARPVTRDRKRGVRVFFWTYTGNHLVYLQDKEGDENWRAYAVDLDADEVRDLTPFEGVRAEVQAVSHRHPDAILVGLNDRDPRYHDLHRVDLKTGERTLVQQNDGYGGFVVDDEYRVRFAIVPTDAGGKEIHIADGEGRFVEWGTVGLEDDLGTNLIGFDQAGTTLYLRDSRGRDTAAFVAMTLPDGDPEILYEDPAADVADAMLHPETRAVQAVASNRLRKRWQYFDDAVAAALEHLQDHARGDVEVVSRTRDDQTWIVAFAPDDGPIRYVRYDRAARAITPLFVNRPALEGLPLRRMQPLEIAARDGLSLVSYLTLPPEVGPRDRPEAPLPMVLLVHGGPWARSAWGYQPYHQWLANRGYAVLDVNFRGSTGFGKAFLNAGNGAWAAAMHDDLIDAVAWAVGEGIADPSRVAIMGGSYGGYATLVGLTFTPEVFACGVDIVGPSNIITLLESVPPYWAPFIAVFKRRVGDHTTEEGRAFLSSRSPLSRADAIVRPLLIGQGANDPRVKQAESDQIVAAMEEKNIPVTYCLYPDEGHGFARPENNKSFNAVVEAFLAAHLGGRAQTIGDDVVGSSLEVKAGADQVPGLAAALTSQG
ncbi:MAG: S9 family peptidase [Myxococcota bacterium]